MTAPSWSQQMGPAQACRPPGPMGRPGYQGQVQPPGQQPPAAHGHPQRRGQPGVSSSPQWASSSADWSPPEGQRCAKMLRRLHQNLAYNIGTSMASAVAPAHSPSEPLGHDNESLNMAHPEAVRISRTRQTRRLNVPGATAGTAGGGVAAAGPGGVTPLPGALPPPGVSAPQEGSPIPALVPIPRQAYWGYPVAGDTVTEARLKLVEDSGLEPGAMVNAGWWFEPRLPRSGIETYRWTAKEVPDVEPDGRGASRRGAVARSLSRRSTA